MITRLRQRLRRYPGAARLLAVAGLLLIASAAHTGVRSGLTACGPQTAGLGSTATNAGWVVLLVAGVLAAVVGGSGAVWPLPAVWLVVALLTAAQGEVGSSGFLEGALALGTVALGAAVWADVAAARARARRSRRER